MAADLGRSDLYWTREALDSSELIVFDVGVFLDTLATHSENSLLHVLNLFANTHP